MKCPQCKSNSTYHRSTTDDYRCQKCGFEFKKSGVSSKSVQGGAGAGCLMLVLVGLACGIFKDACGKENTKVPLSTPEPALSNATNAGYCGAPDHEPQSIRLVAPWTEYRCVSQSGAGLAWATCLKRADYTDKGNGCPGESRCCPPQK